MVFVGAGARNGVRDVTVGPSVLRGIIADGDAILLDRFGSDGSERSGNQIVVVLNAVEQEIR